MKTKLVAILACAPLWMLAGLPSFAAAAPANPFAGMTRFAGTIERVDGNEFLIKGTGDTTATYTLARSTRITTARSGTIADLAAGKFVGCTAVEQADGRLHATECHIFPETMRGVGEGHNPMGPPNTTMTNGNIATMTNGNIATMTNGTVASAPGSGAAAVLEVTYKGGSQRIEVSSRTQITVIKTLSRAHVKAGAKVAGFAKAAPDGTDVVQMLNIAP